MKPGQALMEAARSILAASRRTLVLTGAGISADSGVPTFRGAGGLWGRFRPEELATPEAFSRDPRLVWEWYGWRRDAVGGCAPNAAHQALARWQESDAGVHIATQNVDGLHGLAGSRDRLLEIHGTLFRTRCTECGDRRPHREAIDASSAASLPHCGACGHLLRPDVVWFGEPLDPAVIGLAFEWAKSADACLVIGTSALVQPAAGLASVTRATGGVIVEVNPESTPLTAEAEVSIRGGAAETVPAIVPETRAQPSR